jgi:tricorn protease-like protein/mono/diheme cytochrome c family protein
MLRSRPCYCILCSLIGWALAWLLFFAAPSSVQAQGTVSFINDVAPILKENCFACHDSKTKKGKLDMTTYESFRNGGTKDDPVTPGKAKESILIDVLISMGKDRMPPKDAGKPLPKEKIDIIAKWIDQGGKLDSGIDAKANLVRELRTRWKAPQPPVAYKFPIMINALAITPDSKKVVVGGYHEFTVWDIDSGKLERRVFTRAERAYAMAFLPDGKLAVAGGRPGQEGDVRIYNLQGGTAKDHGGVPAVDGANDKAVLVKVLGDADDSILALAISPDGKKLAAGGCDRLVRVWDLASGKLEHAIENHADWVFAVAFSPDGKQLITGSRDKTAKVWDLVGKESLVTFPDHQNGVYAVAMSPDGQIGISAAEDNNVRMWQATDKNKQIGKQTKVLGTHAKPIFRMAYLADAKKPLLASCSADGTIKLFDPVAGTALKTCSGFTDWVYAVAISPDGKLVAGGSWNGEVRVFKVDDGNLVKSFNASPGFVAKAETSKK